MDLLEISEEDVNSGSVENYVELAITCTEKGKTDSDIIKGVPPLRVYLNK